MHDMISKDRNLNLRIDERLQIQLRTVATSLDVPVSQFIREAIREKIERFIVAHKFGRTGAQTGAQTQ